MGKLPTYHVVGLLGMLALSANAQQVRVMQWNVLGGLGNAANNNTAQAKAIARIINYNQPDILLFNEIENHGVASNTAAIIDFVTNNIPYLGTQTGVTFYVAVSTKTDNFNRNAAVSRYPIFAEGTYDDGLRGLHAFRVQLTGTNVLQVFHTHLKCCADDCPRKQTEAQFDADVMSGWALTNSGPYIFAGDLNEDEQNPECTLSSTYHPITTIREDGGVVEFKPTTLSGEYRTWSTAVTTPSIRFDYILASTNRLVVSSGYVFSTKDWAAHGLYTNASPQNLVGDSATASDHYCVFADYIFSTASPGIVVTPGTDLTSSGGVGGPFSPSNQVYNVANTNVTSLSWNVSKTAAWVTLSATSGTLAGGANTNITVSINSSANSLAQGTYNDTVTFHDLTGGADVNRGVSLAVLGPPSLTVSPSGSFTSSGKPGGPFNPSSQNYTLNNTGNSSLNWTASNTAAWLTLSPVGGTLAAGASTTVVATVNVNANLLAEGVYNDTIGFTNTTNGAGNTTRSVRLTISSSTFGFTDDFNKFITGNLVGQNNWLQLGGSSTLPLQVTGGRVAVPGLPVSSGDNQDAYKSFGSEILEPVTGTNLLYYAASVTVTSAATSPSYFLGTTNTTGSGFINFRLAAKDNGNGTYSLGGRVNGQTGYPYVYGGGLSYGSNYTIFVEAKLIGGGSNDLMRLIVNPTSADINAQTIYATSSYVSGTVGDPVSAGAILISQYTSATTAQSGLLISKLVVADTFANAYNALFPPVTFTVTPASAFSSSGPQGGPFSPSSQVYTLNNTNATPLSWSVTKNATWLALDATSGTLGAGDSTNITVSITSAANFLSPGVSSDNITFAETGNGGGSITRAVNLTVQALPNLAVSPGTAFNSTGIAGGPFSPTVQNYTVSNTGSLALSWTASKSAAWLNLAPVSGSLAAGASTVVTASVNSSANSLAPGSYNDTITFANTTNGAGDTARTANLTVIDPAAGGFFDNMENGTNGWTATGLWHLISAGTPSCTTAESPTHAWWYGQDSTCNYRTCGNCTNYGDLVSPTFVVPNNATLTFWSWEDTEGTGTVNDQRLVFISTNNGTSWVQLLQSTNDAATWYQVSTGLAAFAGKTAQLRFYFNANASNNRFGGWFVDDVQVVGPAALAVTPSTSLSAAGEQGGPFSPGSQTYTLSNSGGGTLNWSASVSNNWLGLTATSGSLGPGSNTTVTVTTNANANALVGGLYSNLISFVNLTTGTGNTNRWASLLVRDGIADAWRLLYFGHIDPKAGDLSRAQDDPDGDGFSNLAEYIFGSVPTNAGSVFQLQIIPLGNGVQLSFLSLTGRLYTIEVNDALGAGGSWVPVGAFTDVAGTGTTLSYADSSPPATRVYRMRGRIGP